MTVLRDVWLRTKARNFGRLRKNVLLSELLALGYFARYLLPVGSLDKRLGALMLACRRTALRPLQQLLSATVATHLRSATSNVWRDKGLGLSRYKTSFGGLSKRVLTTSLLLKEPGPNGEKGVLYSSFEYNWLRLITHHDARRFFEKYYLVGASSGSPPDYGVFAHLAGLAPDPIFIGISNHADIPGYRMMEPVIRGVPLMACDWIDPSAFDPKPRAEREIDIIMVANWLRLKRHWILFEALKHMPRNLRVVLVGRNADGRTEQDMLQEARRFGAMQDFEIHTNVPFDTVAALLSNSKISLLFSYREGSCVAPVESLFANTPVGMMKDAHVGSKAYINSSTGVLLERRGMASALMQFHEESDRFTPRKWAELNVSCWHSTERLNEILRDYAREAGQAWTSDIAPLCWRYVPSYARAEDERLLQPGVERLKSEFGIELERFQYRPTPGIVAVR